MVSRRRSDDGKAHQVNAKIHQQPWPLVVGTATAYESNGSRSTFLVRRCQDTPLLELNISLCDNVRRRGSDHNPPRGTDNHHEVYVDTQQLQLDFTDILQSSRSAEWYQQHPQTIPPSNLTIPTGHHLPRPLRRQESRHHPASRQR